MKKSTCTFSYGGRSARRFFFHSYLKETKKKINNQFLNNKQKANWKNQHVPVLHFLKSMLKLCKQDKAYRRGGVQGIFLPPLSPFLLLLFSHLPPSTFSPSSDPFFFSPSHSSLFSVYLPLSSLSLLSPPPPASPS